MRKFVSELQDIERRLVDAGFGVIHSRNRHLEWLREFRAVKGATRVEVTYEPSGRSRWVHGRVAGVTDRGRRGMWGWECRSEWEHQVWEQIRQVKGSV